MRHHFFSLTRFATVGIATAIIYFIIMWIGLNFFKVNYIIAVSLAYAISTIFHFLANRHFTFEAALGRKSRQLLRYILLWVINYLITIFIVNVCVEHYRLTPYLAVCAAVTLTVFIGYFLSRYWVFEIREGK